MLPYRNATEYEQQIETLQDGKRTLYERYLMGEID